MNNNLKMDKTVEIAVRSIERQLNIGLTNNINKQLTIINTLAKLGNIKAQKALLKLKKQLMNKKIKNNNSWREFKVLINHQSNKNKLFF